MKEKLLFLLLLSLLGLTTCLDDPVELTYYGRVDGTITTLETEEPLAGVTITTNPLTRTVTSGANGYFAFDSLPVENYSFRFRLDGYEEEAAAVDLTKVFDVSLSVVMQRDLGTNVPPGLPHDPLPADGTEWAELSVLLQWQGTDADAEDELTYDLLLYRGTQAGSELVLSQQPDTSCLVNDLAYGVLYAWQVIVYDGVHDPVYGPLWQFSVVDRPDQPILFVREGEEGFEIWSGNTEGVSSRLVDRPQSSWRPRRSPAGDRIAFLSFVGTDAHLFTCDLQGEQVQRVTSTPVGGYDLARVTFAWSPGGDQLLYPSFDKLYRINVDGTGLTELIRAPGNRIFEAVDWSRYNDRIVLRTQGALPYQNELYRYDLSSGNLVLILGDLAGTIGNPCLSLDGSQLLYTHDLSGLEVPSGRQNNASVILADFMDPSQGVNLSGGKAAGFNDLDPRFTPTEAAVIVTEWACDESGSPAIMQVPVDSPQDRALLLSGGRMGDWK
ncbi:MAG: carboxypeptidase regulatory-like domain-containing protein [Lewinella sp.]|nr:carboxypeptidase regulatory-like domain-containing protein [Lewinella sp.]